MSWDELIQTVPFAAEVAPIRGDEPELAMAQEENPSNGQPEQEIATSKTPSPSSALDFSVLSELNSSAFSEARTALPELILGGAGGPASRPQVLTVFNPTAGEVEVKPRIAPPDRKFLTLAPTVECGRLRLRVGGIFVSSAELQSQNFSVEPAKVQIPPNEARQIRV